MRRGALDGRRSDFSIGAGLRLPLGGVHDPEPLRYGAAVIQVAPDLPASPVETGAAPDGHVPRAVSLAAVVLVAAGVALRLGSTSPLWLDEALSANIASLPVSELLDALRRDGHPPLYYLLLHGWMALVGDGDHAVRALSTVFGLATLPLLWAAARRAGGRSCALAATVLYATSPFAIRYSTETRMYSLVAFLVVAGWLAIRRAQERPTLSRLALLSLLAGALLLTHYWSFFLLSAVGTCLLVRVWQARRAGRPVDAPARSAMALAAGTLLFAPWLPAFLAQAGSTGTPWGAPSRPAAVFFASVGSWGGSLGGGEQGESTFLGLSLVLLGLLALLGRAVGGSRIELDLRTRPRVRGEWAVVALTLGLAVMVSYATSAAFAARYTSVIHPLVVLAAGLGVLVLPRQWHRVVTVGVLALIGITFGVVNLLGDRTQAGQLAAAIEADADPDDLVVYCPDQLGPGTGRLLAGTPPGITFPDAGDPRFIDWVDYTEGIRAVDPAAFAREAVERAGDGDIWLVWSDRYRGARRVCEGVVDELLVQRPGRSVIVESGEQPEHAWLYRYAAP